MGSELVDVVTPRGLLLLLLGITMSSLLYWISLISPLLLPLAWVIIKRRGLHYNVKGQTILITGCDTGYGFSLALHCSQHLGMKVLATCFTTGEGRKVLEKTEGVTVLQLDITSRDSREELVLNVRNILKGGGLHCLVNNAATLIFGEAAWQTEDQVINQVSVNMTGPLLLTRALLPHLVTAKGRIINLISNCTTCPLPTLSVYTASKAGLLALSEAMRPELAKYSVKLVIVNPGDAPFNTALTTGQEEHYDRMARNMTVEEQAIYGDYFSCCREKFTELNPSHSLQRIPDFSFYQVMENSITMENPSLLYDNSPIITRILFAMIKILPRGLGDLARLKLVMLPEFKA